MCAFVLAPEALSDAQKETARSLRLSSRRLSGLGFLDEGEGLRTVLVDDRFSSLQAGTATLTKPLAVGLVGLGLVDSRQQLVGCVCEVTGGEEDVAKLVLAELRLPLGEHLQRNKRRAAPRECLKNPAAATPSTSPDT